MILTPGKEGAAFRDGVLYALCAPGGGAGAHGGVGWRGGALLSQATGICREFEELFNAVAPDTEIALAQGEYSSRTWMWRRSTILMSWWITTYLIPPQEIQYRGGLSVGHPKCPGPDDHHRELPDADPDLYPVGLRGCVAV